MRSKHLPAEKQYLITKGVPCSKRIKTLQAQESKEREVEDGWVETDNPASSTNGVKQAAMDIDDIGEVCDIDEDQQQDNQEVMDIDDIQNEESKDNVFGSGKYVVMNEQEDTVHKTRTYNLSITYDFYYKTPRLWLIGYSESG